MLSQTSAVIRLFSFITLIAFFPSCIGIWNFMPDRIGDAIAAEPGANTPINFSERAASGPRENAPPAKGADGANALQRKTAGAASSPRAVLPQAKLVLAEINRMGSEPEKPKLAQLENSSEMAPAASMDAAGALRNADDLKQRGDFPEAITAYFDVMDRFSFSNEYREADSGVWDILNGIDKGTISEAESLAIDEHLATYQAANVEGWYNLLSYYANRAVAEKKAGRIDSMRYYAQSAAEISLPILDKDPENPLQRSIIDYYYQVSGQLGEETLRINMKALEARAASLPKGLSRLCAYQQLGKFYQYHVRDNGVALANYSTAIHDLDPDAFNGWMGSDIPLWLKGEIGLAIGHTLKSLGHYEEAFQYLDAAVKACTQDGRVRWFVAYERASVKAHMNALDPNAEAAAWAEYMSEFPASRLNSMALFRMANVYLQAGDYEGAASLYSEVSREYPDTDASAAAEHELAYILENLNGVRERDESFTVAQLCGPRALHEMLKRGGVDVPVSELASAAGTDAQGTTMLGMQHAGAKYGKKLAGVFLDSVDGVELPFIALLNENHFVFVTGLDNGVVSYVDNEKGSVSISRDEFESRWKDRFALVSSEGGKRMQLATLMRTRGGTSGPEPANPPPPSCDYCPCEGGGAVNGPGTPPPPPGPASDIPGTPHSPTASTSYNSSGVRPIINTFESALYLEERDIALRSRGTTSVTLERVYRNPFGFHRGHFQDAALPYSNNVGDGWTHSLNMHLIAGTGLLRPDDVVFYDSDGEARQYTYSTTAFGMDLYFRSSSGQTNEKTNWIGRNTTTNKWKMSLGQMLTYEFSAMDANRFIRLESIVDNSGNTTLLEYDGAVGTGKLTKIKSPAGDPQHLKLTYAGNLITKAELKQSGTILQTTTYEYDATNYLTKVTDNDGKTVAYEYASMGCDTTTHAITKITDKAGRDTTFAWSCGFDSVLGSDVAYKIDVTAPNGLKTTYDRSIATGICTITNWDGATNLSKMVNTPVSADTSRSRYKDYYLDSVNYDRWSYEYNATGDLTKVFRPGPVLFATYSYNSLGRISTIAGNDGVPVTFSYVVFGTAFPTKVRDKAGLDTTFAYDANNRLTKVVTPWSGANGFVRAYDANGLMTKATDAAGKDWTFTYYTVGDLSTAKDPLNNETKYEWDALGNMTKVTDARGKITTFHYATGGCGGCGSAGGKLTKVTDPLSNQTMMSYDTSGNVTKMTDAKSVVTDFFYDNMNQLTKVESPSGSGIQATFIYNKLGQAITATNFKGSAENFGYDHLGRLTKAANPYRNVLSLFSSAGTLSKITDYGGLDSTFAYDASLRLTSATYTTGKTFKYFYDSIGRLTKVGAGGSGTTDPTQYFFSNTTGLLTKTRFTSGASTADANYAYDHLARVTKLTDWIDGTNGIRYAFDSASRLTKITDYDNSTYDYTYDAAGNVITTDDYHGTVMSYTYTDRNELSTVNAPQSKVWDFDYNQLGQPSKVTHGNGYTSEYVYDNRNRLITLQHKDGGGSVLDRFDLRLDAQGMLTKLYQADGSLWEYEYDVADRLTKAQQWDNPNARLKWTYYYTYTKNDNIFSKDVTDNWNDVTTKTTYDYNDVKELTKKSVGATYTYYGYDDWGQLITKYQGVSHAEYKYHYGGLMTKIDSTFAGEGGVEYEFGGDGKRRERAVTGGTTSWYNYAAGFSPVSEENGAGTLKNTYIGTLADIDTSNPSTGNYSYYFRDHQGSTRRNQGTGSPTLYEYAPYGEIFSSSGPGVSNRYVGMDNEPKGDFLFTPFRMYDAELGRFTSRDPIYSSTNIYAYSFVDPINFSDPSGLDAGNDLLDDIFPGNESTSAFGPWIGPDNNNGTEVLRGMAAVVNGIPMAVGLPPIFGAEYGICEGDADQAEGNAIGGSIVNAPSLLFPFLGSVSKAGALGGGFRAQLIRASGRNPGWLFHAHHVFPRQFAGFFDLAGIAWNNGANGAWWGSASHLRNAYAYNKAWGAFLNSGPKSADDIYGFARAISKQYRRTTYF